MVVEQSIRVRGSHLVETLERVGRCYSLPKVIRVAQGSKCVSRDLDAWAYQRGVTLGFSRPSKPTDNVMIVLINGKFRSECLNAHWFKCLADGQEKCEPSQRDCSAVRHHSAIGNKAPLTLIER
jgi:putative transposase